MTLPKDTPLVDKAAMPTTPDEVLPTEEKEECATISPQDKHTLCISDVVKSTKRLNIHDEKDAATPANIDIPECRHDDKALMSDSKPVGIQQSETASSFYIAPAEEVLPQPHLSTTSSTKSSTKIEVANESNTTALTSTEPVPTIYPPRRPNIFNKRAPRRNVRWRPEVLASLAPHATEDVAKDGDGLTLEELQEFQSENREVMEKKTAKFLGMVSQYSWRPRVVEDLGEAFALDD
ncbi:hypothetical protein NEUTE1DRAFT_141776 [Neurospora tetrasperma FGSC 2508]|uniref:Uncharacterized protein n=1 Tax=Neurospora tetrasperma (strain FGSC 2508 / ATCC MYA-4615 / P0657) TaxID=510951 RepID=F8N4B7_NEUT8|nr:uncharacterized protein NEUTE1DRAFT_141776 [Neurospora tetrasperma FGSC 2508]EGO51860.1 hypothetical protein NEUTE1DRAFT_141776 [Neurospora tetrasperma FGSC 2508]